MFPKSVAVFVMALVWGSHGYQMFADRIPNGEQVPHPCKPNYLWRGVGHFNVDGGGFRNPFGQDFDDGGRQWTPELCRKDSDGDGRTNGEELGDPNCVWRVGDIPTSSTGLSHPGICEPIDSSRCQQKQFHVGLFLNQEEWMAEACKSSDFNCPSTHEPEVRQLTARLELTHVPAKETTYICKIFDFEDIENDYHLIATEPIINNSYILHHMVIFGCEDDVTPRSAYECDMLPDRKCKTIISVWTLGLNGDCYNPNAGVRVGKNGLKKLAIQLHWNNPAQIDSYVDSSGLLIHYTPRLRTNDASVLLLGNEHFAIPPRTNMTQVTSQCAGSCTTRKLTQTIYVFGGFNHMHYLGRKMRVELFRNNSLITTITNDQRYSYDSPQFFTYEKVIPVEPGDLLKTTCEYSSTYKTRTVTFGESTQEEMCYAFLYFYPVQAVAPGNSPMCTTYGSLSLCNPETFKGCISGEEEKWFHTFPNLEVYHNVTEACEPFAPCTAECMQAILTAQKMEPCLTSGEAWDRIVKWSLTSRPEGMDFLASLESCEIEIHDLYSSQNAIVPRTPLSP